MGSNGINPLLPVHPQPQDGEIFSSWFCRIAQSNCVKLHTLEVQLWGRNKQIWTRDIDRCIDEDTIRVVAEVCGTNIDRARSTILRSYEGNIVKKVQPLCTSRWILPIHIYHRKRRKPGILYCPLCLASDLNPYYRKHWRLALTTFCDTHDVMLLDRCPKCTSPVMFYRQELGHRSQTRFDSITHCACCGFDLRRAPTYQASVLEIHAWLTLKSQLFFLDQGWTFNDAGTFQYSHLYFDVLRDLVSKIYSNLSPNLLLDYAEKNLCIPVNLRGCSGSQFESFSIIERHYLLQIATWYLADWPNRFEAACKAFGIRASEFQKDFHNIPFWYEIEIKRLIHKPVLSKKSAPTSR